MVELPETLIIRVKMLVGLRKTLLGRKPLGGTQLFYSAAESEVAWPSGLRRWFKAPVSSEAWVRIPPLPKFFTF